MKIAIVGCGDIARAHLRFIVKESRHSIVGLCDADVAKAEALAKTIGIQKVHRTLVELLELQKPDVVHVLTPPQSHAPLAMSAMRAGCHVLVEKPITTKGADARHLIDFAQSKGLTLMVGHTFLYNSGIRKIYYGEFYRDERSREVAREVGIELIDLRMPSPVLT